VAEFISVRPEAPEDATVRRAAEALRAGETVALPTDTIYGLCARATDPAAVEKLYAAKGRRGEKGAPVLIGRMDQLSFLTQPLREKIWERLYVLWPAPLTLVFPAKEDLSPLLIQGGGVAVRFPAQELCQAIARAAGPFAATSANPPGEPPLGDALRIAAQFGEALSLILDGGPFGAPAPSTLADVRGSVPKLLREGAFPFEKVLGVWEEY